MKAEPVPPFAPGLGIVRPGRQPTTLDGTELARELQDVLAYQAAVGPVQLFLAYQPVVDVNTGATLSLEALVRWTHPHRGELLPDQFIPVAEAAGLMWQLGAWVLRTACRQAVAWPVDARIAVNLSPVQLVDDRLVALVLDTLAETRLDPTRLELEVSERVERADIARAAAALGKLRVRGVRVLLDDFGTEGANLARLLDLPLDGIKLDRGFLAEAEQNTRAHAIIQSVLHLAARLGLDVVAEGVETEAQLQLLTGAGCRMAQGFLFQSPLPSERLPAPWRATAA